jgi:hypothetical protein
VTVGGEVVPAGAGEDGQPLPALAQVAKQRSARIIDEHEKW